MIDPIDEYAVQQLKEYEGKKLICATKEGNILCYIYNLLCIICVQFTYYHTYYYAYIVYYVHIMYYIPIIYIYMYIYMTVICYSTIIITKHYIL